MGGIAMGMTDRQFDSYQANLLDLLRRALDDMQKYQSTKQLEILIARIEAELRRP